MKFGRFYSANANAEHGKSSARLTAEIREVSAEIRKRTNNGLGGHCEDQQARLASLRDARSRQN